MSKTQYKGYILIALSIAIVLLVAMIFACLWTSDNVYADYEDIVNDPNAIVNFNQLVSNYHNVSVGNGWLCQGIPQNHIIYIKYDLTTSANTDMYNNANIREFRVGNYVEDYLYTTPVDNSGIGLYSSQNIVISYFNVIDLTVMFGSNDNVPTLQQCRDLFLAEYYAYDTGSAISLSGLTGYSEGYQDAVNSFTSNTFYEQMTPTNFTKYFESATVTDQANSIIYSGYVTSSSMNWMCLQYNPYTDYTDYDSSMLCGYLPLFNPITANTRVHITCNVAANFGSGSTTNNYFSIYIFNNGVFTKIVDSPIITATQWVGDGAVGYNMEFEFLSPYAIDGIYIVPKRSGFQYYFGNFTLSRQVLDYYAFLDTQFAAGEDHAKEYYDQAYAEGGVLYQQIFNAGKSAGVQQANQYTFFTLMSSVIEAPLNAILGIFNFELLGYNLKNLFTFLLTLCVIVTIVRLIWGNA